MYAKNLIRSVYREGACPEYIQQSSWFDRTALRVLRWVTFSSRQSSEPSPTGPTVIGTVALQHRGLASKVATMVICWPASFSLSSSLFA